jgi:hypothetical protein
MNKIKVKDYKDWEQMNHEDFTQDHWVNQSSAHFSQQGSNYARNNRQSGEL